MWCQTPQLEFLGVSGHRRRSHWRVKVHGGHCRAGEVSTTSQGPAVAVQPASHHRPSFSTSPTMKPPASFDAARLIHPGHHRHSPPRPLPLPTAVSVASVSTAMAAGSMVGSHSHPLVGSMRTTGPRTSVAQKAATLPTSLLADADYMHRFRFFFRTFSCFEVTLIGLI